MPSNEQLVRTAMELRARAPNEWESFLLAMRAYSAEMMTEILRCPPETLMKAQGMAIMAHEVTMILVEAPKIYEKAQRSRREFVG